MRSLTHRAGIAGIVTPVPYALGIDLGTTFTAAAIVRDGQVRMVELGSRAAVVPSVLFLTDEETLLTGEAASRRATTDPGRVAREFKRRIGDPAAILLGGSPWSPEALVAQLLRWTVDLVTEREGEPPALVAVSHPANWGPYKKDLLAQAIRLAELDVDLTITEPEAAAISYAAAERVEPGTVVAVYDLGGGTFDAAVLRKTEDGFTILGEPEGVDRLGGVDFDQAVFGFVQSVLEEHLGSLDPTDPAVMAALSRLRLECVEAKEALSSDTEASIPVLLPNLHTEVRITRAELEAMIRPPLAGSIAALRRALKSAGVTPDEVGVVLLVGGSSRIPLVADLVGSELGRPVAVDTHPKHAVAQGAALAVAGRASAAPAASPPSWAREPEPAREPDPAPEPAPAPALEPEPVAAPRPVVARAEPDRATATPPEPTGGRRSTRPLVFGAAAVVVVAVVGAGLALAGGGGGDDGGDGGDGGDGAAAATECPPAGTPAVCIESVELDESGRLLAGFSTHDVDIASPSGGRFPSGSLHALFFFDTIDPSNGLVWGPSSPFGSPDEDLPGFDRQDAPTSSRQLCVLIQDSQGNVFDGTGNCAPLPEGI